VALDEVDFLLAVVDRRNATSVERLVTLHATAQRQEDTRREATAETRAARAAMAADSVVDNVDRPVIHAVVMAI